MLTGLREADHVCSSSESHAVDREGGIEREEKQIVWWAINSFCDISQKEQAVQSCRPTPQIRDPSFTLFTYSTLQKYEPIFFLKAGPSVILFHDCWLLGGRVENYRAYLHSLHQQHSLRVILVCFQDEVGQLVDDDIEWTLLLQRLAEVQLEKGQPRVKRHVAKQSGTQTIIHCILGWFNLGKYYYVIAAAENWLLLLALQSAKRH